MRFRKNARLDPSQVEDYRGASGGSGRPGGVPITLGGGGLIGVLVLVAFLLLSGGGGGVGNLGALAGQTVGPGTASTDLQTECRTGADANEHDDCRIVAVVNSVQAYWAKTVRNYEPARTRFFTESIQTTGCGTATSAVGPFYCPNDSHVYIDLGFFGELHSKLGARGGPLAEAYVLAHEYGHHIQNLNQQLRGGSGPGPQGGQVRLELQADCYAGLWVGHALETGFVVAITRQDVADALDAAASVGDDRIQGRVGGPVRPESWTHGSAEQRKSWFIRGVEGSGPRSCDTFRGRV